MLVAALTQAESDACGDDATAACLFIWRRTHNEVAARTADWLIARPLRIALIVVLALVASRIVHRAIDRFVAGVESASRRAEVAGAARAAQRAHTIGAVLRSAGRAVILVVAGLMVLSELSLDLGPLLAGAGIVGIAVGFGAQTLVRDILSGMFMLIEDQFGVGDVIDAGVATGVVESVGLRTTRLRDEDGVVWHVPNGEIHRIGNRSQR